MTEVLRPSASGIFAGHSTGGKIFITRHGERADLADEEWLARAEVRASSHLLLLHRSGGIQRKHVCPGC